MAVYSVNSEEIVASATQVHSVGESIRSEVETMMQQLLALQDSWAGVASNQFAGCVTQWRSAQIQVEAALDSIGTQMNTAASVYSDAENKSSSLFTS